MVANKKIIIRLSRYKNALSRLRNLGFIKVFSENLGDATGVTAAQVRKDFSMFGITGNKRGGYQIDELINRLNNILGKDKVQNVAVVGAGNIGSALMKYKGFEKEGIKILAAFDVEPGRLNEKTGVPVLALDKLESFVKKHDIRIAVLAVPDTAAQLVLDRLVACGIKGVLNFAPIRLRAPEEVIITYVNLGGELENLIYFVNALEKTGNRLV